MAACVETMFSVRETPWHGLGIIIKEAVSSEQALKLAGLDWDVIQTKLICQGTLDEVPGYMANIRSTDHKILGVVSNKYKIVQNKEAFAFTDALLGDGVKYETAGSLSSGRRVWMLARMEGRMMTDEKVDPYLVFTNSHDGTGAVQVAITPVRVVCQNTLNLALHTARRRWSCAQIGEIEEKMEEATKTLLNANHYLESLEEEFGELKMKKMTDDKVREFINELLPIEPDAGTLKKTNVERLRDDVMFRYLYAPDLQPIEKSAYRFLNAVSDFATHREPARRTPNFRENRFMLTADGNPLIDKAYSMVLTL